MSERSNNQLSAMTQQTEAEIIQSKIDALKVDLKRAKRKEIELKRRPVPEDVAGALRWYIGDALAGHRRTKGITQMELAKHLKVSRTSIANIEAGTHETTLYRYIKAFDFCGGYYPSVLKVIQDKVYERGER